MSQEPDLVVIYVSQGPLRAQVIKGKLETLHIPVLLRYEAVGRVLGLTVDGLGRVEVLVPRQFAAAASEAVCEEPDPLPDADEGQEH